MQYLIFIKSAIFNFLSDIILFLIAEYSYVYN
jgi:hypothetical protein